MPQDLGAVFNALRAPAELKRPNRCYLSPVANMDRQALAH
jgi:hypothetical protein